MPPVPRRAGATAAALVAAGALVAASPAASSLAATPPRVSTARPARVPVWADVPETPGDLAPQTYAALPRSREPLASRAAVFLSGVAAISSDDIWAVGSTGSTAAERPAAEHWNGSAWSQATVPAPHNSTRSYLNAIAAISANDVWAVGSKYSTTGHQLTLIEHWNGSTWSVVKSPNFGPDLNQLNGVNAVSANNVWAVGNTLANGIIETEIEHWNGSTWSVVPSPNMKGANANQLNQLSVVSATNIWAVGYWAVLNIQYTTLAEHWNGKAWSIVKTPPSTSVNYDLQGTAPRPVSASDIWGVGSIYDNTAQKFDSLAEHWNGTAWKRVPIPSEPGSRESVLFNAAALTDNDVWADGWYETPSSGEAPLMEHWDGTSWSLVTTPKISNAPYYDLFSLAAISTNDIWAVGTYTPNGTVWHPLYEHWNGTAWKIVGPS